MSSSGSVGVRFFIAGGQEVTRSFDQIRDSGRRMWQDIANGSKTAAPGIRVINQAVVETKSALANVAAEAGSTGRILAAFGPAGVVAAVGIGAMLLAMEKAKGAAIEYGAEIGDHAERYKVSTDALQEYRYAVQQTGGDLHDADAALEAFTSKFGGARAGQKRDLLPFQQLGFSKADLQQFQTADQMIGAVADKIANLANDAEQADIAEKLGLSPMLTLLRRGADGMEELRKKAHDTGNVLDKDIVIRAGNANNQFLTLSGTIKTSLAAAFSGLIPTIVTVMGWIGKLAAQIAKLPGMKGSYRDTDDDIKSFADLKSQRAEVAKKYEAARNDKVSNYGPAIDVSTGETEDDASYQKRTAAMIVHQRVLLAQRLAQLDQAIEQREKDLAKASGNDPDAKHGTAHLIPVQENTDAATQADQQQKRFLSAMAQAQQKRLQAEDDDTKSVLERYEIGIERLAAEQDTRHAELAQAVHAKELTSVQADEVRAAEDSARQAEAAALARKAQHQIIQQTAAYDQRLLGFNIDMLRIAEQMSVKVSDRYKLQSEIYELERAQERAALEKKLDDEHASPAQRDETLGGFDKVTEAGKGQIKEQQDGLQQTIHDATRDGFLAGLKDGPEAALKTFFEDIAKHFAEKAADEFADKMQDVFNDVLKDIGGAIGTYLKGDGGGGLGGIFGDIGSALGFGGGHASGGGMQSGYRYNVAEHGTELAVFGRSGQVFDPTSTMKLLGGARGDGGVTVHTTFAPVYNVKGNSEDIIALRQHMARTEDSFRSNVVSTVNDAHARGMINTKRK